jgi:hypothetical protein
MPGIPMGKADIVSAGNPSRAMWPSSGLIFFLESKATYNASIHLEAWNPGDSGHLSFP